MKTTFEPTEAESTSFLRSTRGTFQRRIEPQPWTDGFGLWMWKHHKSSREFDVMWVEGMADDMLDDQCPFAKCGHVFWTSERGLKIRAESVRAEKTPEGWIWVIMWRVA